jgi:hypothetical protein
MTRFRRAASSWLYASSWEGAGFFGPNLALCGSCSPLRGALVVGVEDGGEEIQRGLLQ